MVFFINNLAQTGKIFLHWFDGNQFLTFPAKGMAFKVHCVINTKGDQVKNLPYYMKFWRHFNLAILAIFQKIAKLKCTKIKCR